MPAKRPYEKHGMCDSLEYGIWCKMIERCNNPRVKDFANYGGRGIRVCERWLNSFVAFHQDMGSRPSTKHEIDRQDNNGDYCPENCKWVPHIDNSRNKRTNVIVEYQGVRRTVVEWSEQLNIKYGTLRYRIKKGWKIEDAFFGKLWIKPLFTLPKRARMQQRKCLSREKFAASPRTIETAIACQTQESTSDLNSKEYLECT